MNEHIALLAQLQALARNNPSLQLPQLPAFPNGTASSAAATAAAVQLLLSGAARRTDAASMAAVAAAAAQLEQHQQQQRRGSQRRPRNSEQVRRTVYVSDLDPLVSEETLSACFQPCGPIVDCRICGDPNSTMRFGFIEFYNEDSAHNALCRNGTLLGAYCIRVAPSKTCIIPVDRRFLPRSQEEKALVARTVYVTNIHRTIQPDTLRYFLENLCGRIIKVRLLGDANHDTKIAFVEFASEISAQAALGCTGVNLGPLPIRLAPSKTPVRTETRGQAARAGAAYSGGGGAAATAAATAAFVLPPHTMPLANTNGIVGDLLESDAQRSHSWSGHSVQLGASHLGNDSGSAPQLSLPSLPLDIVYTNSNNHNRHSTRPDSASIARPQSEPSSLGVDVAVGVGGSLSPPPTATAGAQEQQQKQEQQQEEHDTDWPNAP